MFTTLLYSLLSLAFCERLFVFETFRHGARNPCDNLDEHNNDYLGFHHDVLGELSPVGQRMHYALGVRNRYRYKDFLSEKFDPREIHVVSSDVNRTISSALSHISGLYPPSENGVKITEAQKAKAVPPNELSDEVKAELDNNGDFSLPKGMTVIPVHLFHVAEHNFLLQEENGDCEYIKPFRTKNLQKDIIKENAKKFNATYFEKLKKFFKIETVINPEINFTSNFTFNNYICDHFIADYTEGLDMKNLSDVGIDLPQLEKDCQEVLALKLFEVVVSKDDPKMTKMSMTAPMNRILDWMTRRVELDGAGKGKELYYDKPRFVIFSGHDTTVGVMEMFMSIAYNINKTVNPIYAGNLFLELHKGSDNNYYVEYYLNDELIKTIPFTEFKEGIINNSLSDKEIDAMCNFQYVKKTSTTPLIVAIVVLAVVVGILIALVIVLSIKMKKNKEYSEAKLV